MNAIGYARVSTDAQAEDGFGVELQERAIQQMCRERGMRLKGIVRDEAVSGAAPIEERPGLAEAVATVADGHADALVVARLDRLARRLDVQEAALARVWEAGGHVYAADTGEVLRDDPDDPMRTFVRQVLGAVSQLDRAMIAARLRAGRRMKAERGGFAYGSPPFGYRAEDGELVPDPAEQATIRRIRELLDEGRSLRGIARSLEAEKRPPKRSARWHPEALRVIVQRLRVSERRERAS